MHFSFADLRRDAAQWCQEQSKLSLFWRAPLWAYLVFAGLHHLISPDAGDLFALLTPGVHELGHFLFTWCGEFFYMAGGSLAQIAAPLIALGMFWGQRDFFALAVGGFWLASSAFNLANYIADARAQELELVSPMSALGGGEPIHDWHYLLSHLGLLRFDISLGWLVRAEAALVLIASLAWGGWILWRIWIEARSSTG